MGRSIFKGLICAKQFNDQLKVKNKKKNLNTIVSLSCKGYQMINNAIFAESIVHACVFRVIEVDSTIKFGM